LSLGPKQALPHIPVVNAAFSVRGFGLWLVVCGLGALPRSAMVQAESGAAAITASSQTASTSPASRGVAFEYPGDAGIGRDSQVLFAEDFETGTLADPAWRWGEMSTATAK
jgi:hypothetical protein